MKVLFAYPNLTKALQMPFGIGYLSAVLKQEGHKTEIFDATFQDFKELGRIVKSFNPDILCVSATTSNFNFSLEINNLVKSIKPEIISVFGGIHPTAEPFSVIKNRNIDYVFIGESEF